MTRSLGLTPSTLGRNLSTWTFACAAALFGCGGDDGNADDDASASADDDGSASADDDDDDGGSTQTDASADAGDDDDDDDDATDDATDDASTDDASTDDASTDDASTDDASTDDASTDDDSTGDPACGAEVEPTEWPTSGFYMHFTVNDEHAHLWVDNEDTIDYVDAWLVKPDVPIGIPGGPIELEDEFNPGYSYRLVPGEVVFGEVWTEVCDAEPCFVEADAEAWAASPGDWCPWAFELVEIWDCREGDGTSCEAAYP